MSDHENKRKKLQKTFQIMLEHEEMHQKNMQKTLQITLEHGKTETMRKSYEKHVKTAQNAKITTKLLQKLSKLGLNNVGS